MHRLIVVVVPWSAGMVVMVGSIYAETVVRRHRSRKRAELRRRLVVINGGKDSAPVYSLAVGRG